MKSSRKLQDLQGNLHNPNVDAAMQARTHVRTLIYSKDELVRELLDAPLITDPYILHYSYL